MNRCMSALIVAATLLTASPVVGAQPAAPGDHEASGWQGIDPAVRRWLECNECRRFELTRLVQAVSLRPAIFDQLALIAHEGTSPVLRARNLAHLKRVWTKVQDFAEDRPDVEPKMSLERYLEVYGGKYQALAQIKAAAALAAIGGADAAEALAEALAHARHSDADPDVIEALEAALSLAN